MPNYDLETPLDRARAEGRRTLIVSTPVPQVRTTVTVSREEPSTAVTAPEVRTTDIGQDPAKWDADALMHYVVRQIEAFHGPFPKDAMRNKAIFSSFVKRHGELAGPIAVYAFKTKTSPGYWRGAPISTGRFCKKSDEFFADPIKALLAR